MGVQFKEVNFSKLVDKLGPCCLSEEECRVCKKEQCLVGYGKECLKSCMINKVTYVEDGYNKIPITDTKVYDEEYMIDGIVDILKACKSCSENHYDNCIVNLLRSCYEVSLLGEEQKYEGSAFVYLNNLQSINPELAAKVFEKYNSK